MGSPVLSIALRNMVIPLKKKKKKCPSTQQCARDGKRDRAVSSEGLSGDDSSLVDQVVRIIMVCTIIVVSLITARVRQTTKSTEV